MTQKKVTIRDLRTAIEDKAYAYGVSHTVCTLLGEYLVECLTQLYARKNTHALVQNTHR